MPTGYNIVSRPMRDSRVSFEVLKNLTDHYDIARMCIGHRIDDVRSLGYAITAKRGYNGDPDEVVAEAEALMAYPEGPGATLPFHAWVAKYLEDVLRYDAGCLYRRRDRAGRVIGLKVVSGTTIAPVLDYWGDTPLPPAPAYVQFNQGVPWKWLTTEDLIYVPFRPQPDSPYGFAPLEAVLLNANTDMRFQMHFLKWFTEGTVPEGFATAPEDISDPDQLEEYQQYWDALLWGDDAAKHQLKWVPFGTKFEWSKSGDFNDAFPLYLMRKTAAAYHITPNDLGWTETVNRATADTQVDVQFRIGTLPLVEHLECIINSYLQVDRGLPVEFNFDTGQEKEDRLAEAQTWKIYVDAGAASTDEMRRELTGLPVDPDRPTPRFYSTPRLGPVPLLAIEAAAGKTDPETFGPAKDQPALDQPFVPPIGVVPHPGTTDDQASMAALDQAQISARAQLEREEGGTALRESEQQRDARGQAHGWTPPQQQPAPVAAPGTGQQPAQAKPQQPAPVAKALSGAEAGELAAFRRFVKHAHTAGSWTRDFEFTEVDQATAADLNAGARLEVMLKAADPVAKAVYAQLSDDFPQRELDWVLTMPWTGPVAVPLADIDFSNRAEWAAAHEPKKVGKFRKKMEAGKRVKPAVLIARPGKDDLMVADGHHRALAARDLGEPLPAYVAHPSTTVGPWDELHASQIRTKGDAGMDLYRSEIAKSGLPGLTKRSGMISLDLAPGTIPAAPGGPTDHHITIVYLGKDVDDDAYAQALARAGAAAAAMPGPITGSVGGLGTFPPSAGSDGLTPAFAEVELPGAHELHAHLADLSASEHKDYHPHVTLKYLQDGEQPPQPVPPTAVTFTHLSVHRGGKVVRVPLGPQGAAMAKAGEAGPKAQPDQPGDSGWPGWRLDLAAAAYWQRQLAGALTGAVSPRQLADEFIAANPGDTGDRDNLVRFATAWIRGERFALVAALEAVLKPAYLDGFLIGAASARAVLAGLDEADLPGWQPGRTARAQQLLGQFGASDVLEQLLGARDLLIDTMSDSLLAKVAEVLADGVLRGGNLETLAQAVLDAMTDQARLARIALTEITYASSTAALSVYRLAGIQATRWQTDSGPCPVCQDNEDAGAMPIGVPFPSGDLCPPAHPHCRCAPLPVREV